MTPPNKTQNAVEGPYCGYCPVWLFFTGWMIRHGVPAIPSSNPTKQGVAVEMMPSARTSVGHLMVGCDHRTLGHIVGVHGAAPWQNRIQKAHNIGNFRLSIFILQPSGPVDPQNLQLLANGSIDITTAIGQADNCHGCFVRSWPQSERLSRSMLRPLLGVDRSCNAQRGLYRS